ncbi:hypothetical protein [uncultured Shewanella sp.]|nr:hypothetical protein [uncultured Shewanella sp.]
MMLSLTGLSFTGTQSRYSEYSSELCLEALSTMYAVVEDWIGGIA